MPYFQEVKAQPAYDPYWCPKCEVWYRVRAGMENISCAVNHRPGGCCHYSEEQVEITPYPSTHWRHGMSHTVEASAEMLRSALEAERRAHKATRRVVASLLSAVYMNHGDVAWKIYREHSPEMADFRAWRDAQPTGG